MWQTEIASSLFRELISLPWGLGINALIGRELPIFPSVSENQLKQREDHELYINIGR